jgi:hypothetical protein
MGRRRGGQCLYRASRKQASQKEEDRVARIVVTEFVSLDGVMEAPGGEDFKYPG